MSDTVLAIGSFAASLYFTAVRIETQGPQGNGAGTGFVFGHQPRSDGSIEIPMLVTNRHVVQGADVGRIVFLEATDETLSAAKLGKKFFLAFTEFEEHWHHHTDPSIDLSIMPLAPYLKKAHRERGAHLFLRAIPADLVPSPQHVDAVEDVYMVGFPNALMDEEHHLPIVRKGITATPWGIDYEGRQEFLVDISVFPGSSGSPVFLSDRVVEENRHGTFLGVLHSGFFRTTDNQLIQAAIPGIMGSSIEVREMLDLGVVIRSTVVRDFIATFVAEHAPKGEPGGA